MKINRLYNLDCREGLKRLLDNSIDCCISSPPYWSLRDYGIEPSVWDGDPECEHNWELNIKEIKMSVSDKSTLVGYTSEDVKIRNRNGKVKSGFCSKCGAWLGCLGLEPTFELYIKHLADIYDLVKQKLKKRGTCWVNLGDCYSSKPAGNPYSSGLSKEPNPSQSHSHRKDTSQCRIPQKCLLMIPQRFAIEMINRGWILRNVIIWHKPNCMPSSAKDRFTVDFEYVYFFVKSKKYWFEQQREPLSIESLKDIAKRDMKKPFLDGSKGSKTFIENAPKSHDKSTRSRSEFYDMRGRNKRCVWKIPTKPNPEAHFATFPPNLVKPMIKAGCPEEGLVLDPFAGTGTTLKTAFKLGRNFIGFEISKEYCKIAKKGMGFTKTKRLSEFF